MLKRSVFLCLFCSLLPSKILANGIPRLCVQNLQDPNEFVNRWGEAGPSSNVPSLFHCPGDNKTTTRLMRPKLVLTDDFNKTWVSAIMSAPREEFILRSSKFSFMIPSTAFRYWNHLANHTSFDEASFDRVGAAIFKDRLVVQFSSAECAPDESLLNSVPIPGGIQANRWYSTAATTKIQNGQFAVNVQIFELASEKLISQTSYSTNCIPGTLTKPGLHWFIGSAALAPKWIVPNFEAVIADFQGATN